MSRVPVALFVDKASALFASNKTSGSVWITIKPYRGIPYQKKGQRDFASPSAAHPEEPMCILRATDGSAKISTLVNARDAAALQVSLTTLFRTNMTGLKKSRASHRNRSRGSKKHTTSATPMQVEENGDHQ
eukprot:ANDGO_05327.mRNA.1 Signal recognition particle 14 kDa protein